MSWSARAVITIYAWLLKLYPRHFRAEFGNEMRAVFALMVAEASQRDQLFICLKELRELPFHIVQEHLYRKRVNMNIRRFFNYDKQQEIQIVRWLIRITGLLASAFFLFTFFKLDQLGRLPSWGIPLLVVFVLTTASMLLAWRWETLGGRLMMLCAVALGLAGGYATYIYATTIPDVSGGSKLIVFILAMIEWMLPFLIFGWLFVKVGRHTEMVEKPAQ